MKIAIIGAGLTGATIARQAVEKGHSVVIFEKQLEVGGHVSDTLVGSTHISTFGPHIFHTDSERVWEFARRYASWRPHEHRVRSLTQWGWLPWPINRESVEAVWGCDFDRAKVQIDRERNIASLTRHDSFERRAQMAVGFRLYDAFLRHYTEKQWQRPAREVPAEVFKRVRVKGTYDDLFFNDKYIALPTDGYTSFVQNILDHHLIEVVTGVGMNRKALSVLAATYDLVFNTAPPDTMWDHLYGELDYLKVDFGELDQSDPISLAVERTWPTPVVNFALPDTPLTRGTAYHRLYGTATPRTIVEYPGRGEKLYPVRTQASLKKLEKYLLALSSINVVSTGRLGAFKYIDMHVAISEALDLTEGLR